jgi:glycosyltransferase involved in cell wall biosynthesis
MDTVLRLITRLNIGGPARQALLLTKALRGEYETVLGAGRPPDGEGELTDPDVAVTPLPFTRPLRPATDARALAATRQLLVERRPSVLHTHMAKAGAIGRVAARTVRHRPRTVHTFHGHVLDGYFSPRTERLFVQAERTLAHLTDVLVAVSEQTRDDLLALGIGRPEQFRVIHLGFELGGFRAINGRSGVLRDRLPITDSDLLVGVVGRLAPIKDHELLLDAVARVADVHLAVIGDGDRRRALEAQATELRIDGRVHFVGWCHDMPAALADLDAVICSSRNEGTPVALIEAGAAGLPVISTDVGGVRSIVEEDFNGIIVPVGDAPALGAALERLGADAELRTRLGSAGRARSTHFDADRLVRDIHDLYKELLP